MDLLRAGDRERYLTVLFAPQDRRAAFAALYAFNLETARVRDLVSEPMPGEIRLQWWREVISGDREGEGRQHPVAAALLDAVGAHDLSREALANLTEARVFDLYNDPMPDRTTLEGYLGETVSVLFQLSAQILDPGSGARAADAAGHAGVALGIDGLIRRIPQHRARGQVYVPADILSAAGTDASGWLDGGDREAMQRAVSILVELGREHLARAETALSGLDKPLRVAFLPLSSCAPAFRRGTRASALAWEHPVSPSPVAQYLRVVMRAIRG